MRRRREAVCACEEQQWCEGTEHLCVTRDAARACWWAVVLYAVCSLCTLPKFDRCARGGRWRDRNECKSLSCVTGSNISCNNCSFACFLVVLHTLALLASLRFF